MLENRLDIHIVANAALGPYMSGGDRIFIECARRWAEQGHRVTIYVWEEGLEMCRRNKLAGVNYIIWPALKYKRFGFGVNYLMRTLVGSLKALALTDCGKKGSIIYSASDFWPDAIPAFFMKLKMRSSKWAAGFYLFAPNPFKGFRGAHRKEIKLPALKELLYYIHQKPVYLLIKNIADAVFVTCEDDREHFIKKGRSPEDVITVRGGVDAQKAQERLSILGERSKEYDACFVGRFHPQKGVIELIKIWKLVCEKRRGARLAVIGADSVQYRDEVIKEIERLKLTNEIDLLGFMDGEDKYEVFRKSRMILHPAVYDSGGMAACEGMAWGLPAVSFDLPALRKYYPKGMLKAKVNDLEGFASLVLNLINDSALYSRTRSEAIELALEWDWDKRARELIEPVGKRAFI
ncbi:MAG: glycosyltransferase family 4 protein [Deltaproteobacteria bacterium]|nr:glycosyltransferase family 4 protein [Deltaproteobacteria bacterium]